MRLLRALWSFVLVVVVAVSTLIGATAAAQAEPDVTCDSGFGTKVPVLMVHGFDSSSSMWRDGETSMQAALSKVQDVKTFLFNYADVHFNWVTDENIGSELAKTIDCLSRSSKKSGGTGKVIVVAHSMGGLAARYAASQTVEGRKVADELGLVITLGTPHLGSPWSTTFGSGWRWYCGVIVGNVADRDSEIDKCRTSEAITGMAENSSQLSSLPKFPASVPVRAIAGQVKVVGQLLFASTSLQLSDDEVVPVISATAEYTNTGRGDGKFVFQCQARIIATLLPGGWQLGNLKTASAECSHNELPKTGYIQESVRKGIEEYLASTRTPAVPLTDFFGLQLPLGSEWEVLKAPDDPFSDVRKIVVDKKSCGAQDYRPYCSGFVVAKMGGADPKLPYKTGETCNYDQVHDDLGWSSPKVVGTVTVDGVAGEHFTQKNICKLEDGASISRQGDTLHGWRFPSKGIMVYDSEGMDNFNTPLPGLEKLLEGATWK